MDAAGATPIKKVKSDGVERMSKNEEIGSVNEEKDMIIERYEKVLSLLKGFKINENDLVHIKKPLDELESYLKHIPNGPCFNDVFPTEIKDRILSLSSPCDTNAFIVASVCEDWKIILGDRFKEQNMIYFSETDKPAALMEAAAARKLDVHLVIDKPVTEVDAKLTSDALTSVSKFTITNNFDVDYDVEILSDDQLEHFFASIEKGNKIMDEVKLMYLDLTRINQERLANCLVTKIKKLTLEAVVFTTMLDIETFLSGLLQDSAELKLSYLTLTNIDLFQNGDFTNVANALCKVENVKLSGEFDYTIQIVKELMRNILEKPIAMKTLIIDTDYVTYLKEICSPQDLKTVFTKMTTLQLDGHFTAEQLDAVGSLSDVQVEHVRNSYHVIKKGSNESL